MQLHKKDTSTSGGDGEEDAGEARPLLSAIDRLVSAPGPAGVETAEVGDLLGYLSTSWSGRPTRAAPSGRCDAAGLRAGPDAGAAGRALVPGQRGVPPRHAEPRRAAKRPVPYARARQERGERQRGADGPRANGHGNGRGGSATQFIPAAWWARLSPRAQRVFNPFMVAEVAAVTAERAAADAWAGEDALWLADGGSAAARL